MNEYIYTIRKGINIIDLEKTQEKIKRSARIYQKRKKKRKKYSFCWHESAGEKAY